MYVGATSLMMPQIQKARENQNGLMGAAATGAGVVLSIGLGKIASNILRKVVDKAVDFWDEVKPKEKETNEEEKSHG